MKKKLTVNTLALGNLKQRRKQYTIMIIGIILAMVFSSSSIFFVYSMRDSAVEISKNALGSQYKIEYIVGADESTYADMKNEEFFSEYGLGHNIGFAYTDDQRKGSQIGWFDENCKSISYMSFIEGNYPTAENEIAVEKTQLLKMGYENAKIGDIIKLNFKIQNEDEYLERETTKEYKLSGILTDKKFNISKYDDVYTEKMIPAIFVAENTKVDLGGKEQVICYHNRPNIGLSEKEWTDYFTKIDNYWEKHNHTGYEVTVGADIRVLGSGTNISGDANFTTILSVVLMLASCLAIINAFNSTLKERRKQIGMLRAIGATKRQIINIFGREALIITLVTTPISIAISYGLVFLLSGLFGDNFIVSKSFSSLIACVVIDIIVVMLSALLPLLSASRTTPMHAIRNVANNRKMKSKKIKSQKTYDMPSLLAKRYRMFYKSSNALVCVILALTIFVSCFGMGVAKGITAGMEDWDYDYRISVDSDYWYNMYNSNESKTGLSNAEIQDINSLPYVESAKGYKTCSANILVDGYDDYLRCIKGSLGDYGGAYGYNGQAFKDVKEYPNLCLSDFSNEYYSNKSKYGFNKDYVNLKMYALDYNAIKNYEVYDGEINIDKLNSGKEIILVAPKQVALKLKLSGKDSTEGFQSGLYYDDELNEGSEMTTVLTGESCFNTGDDLSIVSFEYGGDFLETEEIDMSKMKKISHNVKIGAIISPKNFENRLCEFGLLTSVQGMENYSKNEKYIGIDVNCNTEVTPQIEEEMMDKLQKIADKHDAYVSSNYAIITNKEHQQKMWYLVIVSIAVLAFAICAGIINNTLTANIRDNKKEIGTLRAVGASEKELVMSYIKQLLSVFGLGYGIGFSLYVIYLIAMYVFEVLIRKKPFNLSINPWLTIGFCIMLFALCSANLWSRIRKEMKNSIVENIREL